MLDHYSDVVSVSVSCVLHYLRLFSLFILLFALWSCYNYGIYFLSLHVSYYVSKWSCLYFSWSCFDISSAAFCHISSLEAPELLSKNTCFQKLLCVKSVVTIFSKSLMYPIPWMYTRQGPTQQIPFWFFHQVLLLIR